MTDRTVRVRLLAEWQQYSQGLRQAAAETRAFGSELDKAVDSMSGQKMTQVGASLTRNVTLPLAGLGVVAGKLAVDFDDAFQRMQGLAGVAASEVDGLKESVLDLAGETGRAPKELADALYFARSAGLDAGAAMDVVETSAKGAAIGLGDTAVVADLLTSVMGAYGESVITAAEAGDVLVRTARLGKAEAASLAPQMGRLLPIAAELGVEFHEVGAGLAFLSRQGGGAELATTNLGNVMQKLLTPTEEGVRALDAIGVSAEELRRRVDDDGLLDTLVFLRGELEANGLQMSDFSRDAQFVTGALALTADEGTKARPVFQGMADDADDMDSAFARLADSIGFKNRQAFADMQASLIEFGDILVPIAGQVLTFGADVLGVFADLPGPVQTALVAFLGLAAAAGPLASLGGNVKKLHDFLDGLGPAGKRAAGGMAWLGRTGAWAVGTLALLEGVGALGNAIAPLERANLSSLSNSLLDLAETGRVTGELASVLGDDLGRLGEAVERIGAPSVATQIDNAAAAIGDILSLGNAPPDHLDQARARISDLDAALAQLASTSPQAAADALSVLTARFEEQGVPASRLTDLLPEYQGALDGIDTASRTAGGGVGEMTDAERAQLTVTTDLVKALEDYENQLRSQFDPLFAFTDALLSNADAQAQLTELQNSGTATAAELDAAYLDVARSALDADLSARELATALQTQGASSEGARSALSRWVAQGLLTQEQADRVAAEFDEVIARADAMHGRDIEMNVRVRYSTFGRLSAGINDILAGRAGGGPVMAGSAYQVAEVGTELFRGRGGETIFLPSVDGEVIPHHKLTGLTPGGGTRAVAGGGGLDSANIFVTLQLDGQDLVTSQVRWSQRNGALPYEVRSAERVA